MRKKDMMKRLLSYALCVMLVLLSAVNVVVADSPMLSDIKGNQYESILNKWLEKGFVKGYPDKTFRPNQFVQRAELMALVNRFFLFTEQGKPSFEDVKEGDWFYKDVAIASKTGYLLGSAGRAYPFEKITRQMLAVIAARLGKLDTTMNNEALKNLSDADKLPEWSKGAICASMTQKLFEGFVTDKFNPEEPVTRLEVVVVLDRLHTLINLVQQPIETLPSTPGLSIYIEGLTKVSNTAFTRTQSYGSAYTLAPRAELTLANGTKLLRNITWTPGAVNTNISGARTIIGAVEGYGNVTLTLTVPAPVSSSDDSPSPPPPPPPPPANVPASGVTFSHAELSIISGQTHTIEAVVAPANASNKGLTWTTSDISIARVSPEGVITGVLAGTATITAETHNGHKATCTVKVKPAAPVIVELDKQTNSQKEMWADNIISSVEERELLANGEPLLLDINLSGSLMPGGEVEGRQVGYWLELEVYYKQTNAQPTLLQQESEFVLVHAEQYALTNENVISQCMTAEIQTRSEQEPRMNAMAENEEPVRREFMIVTRLHDHNSDLLSELSNPVEFEFRESEVTSGTLSFADNRNGTGTFIITVLDQFGSKIKTLSKSDFEVELPVREQRYNIADNPLMALTLLEDGTYQVVFSPGFAVDEVVNIYVEGQKLVENYSIVITKDTEPQTPGGDGLEVHHEMVHIDRVGGEITREFAVYYMIKSPDIYLSKVRLTATAPDGFSYQLGPDHWQDLNDGIGGLTRTMGINQLFLQRHYTQYFRFRTRDYGQHTLTLEFLSPDDTILHTEVVQLDMTENIGEPMEASIYVDYNDSDLVGKMIAKTTAKNDVGKQVIEHYILPDGMTLSYNDDDESEYTPAEGGYGPQYTLTQNDRFTYYKLTCSDYGIYKIIIEYIDADTGELLTSRWVILDIPIPR